MNKWKSKLIAVVTALCMALSVPVFAGLVSVYAATQTMTDSTQFNRMDRVLKKNSAAEKKALKFIKGTWYTQGGVPYHNKTWSYVKKKYKLNTTNFLFLCNC